jgi:hypothetical protein
MKTEEENDEMSKVKTRPLRLLLKHNGMVGGFSTNDASFAEICWLLAQNPDVAFSRRRRFFYWSDNLENKFVFHGMPMCVKTDAWDGGVLVECEKSEITICQFNELTDFVGKGIALLKNSPSEKFPAQKLLFFSTLVLFPMLGTNILSREQKIGLALMWLFVLFISISIMAGNYIYTRKIRDLLQSSH